MTRKLILEMLERLCLEFRNMLLELGFVVETRIVSCHNNINSLHVQVRDSEGQIIVEFHVWDEGDDYAENMYRTTFMYILQGVHFAMSLAEFYEEMQKRQNSFDWLTTNAPSHGGIWN